MIIYIDDNTVYLNCDCMISIPFDESFGGRKTVSVLNIVYCKFKCILVLLIIL